MKARITKKGTLVVKGETREERRALKAWNSDFAKGKAAFRVVKKIKRAPEDVAMGRFIPQGPAE